MVAAGVAGDGNPVVSLDVPMVGLCSPPDGVVTMAFYAKGRIINMFN